MVHALLNQDECQREGFGEVVRHVVSPFDFSRTLPVGGGLLVPCSLPGPPVVKHLMQMVLWWLARRGGISQCASPNSISHFLEEISSLSHSIVSLYFFVEAGFLISPCYSLELFIQMHISFLFSFAFHFFSQLFVRPPQTAILLF